jgi:hypothetical protein
VQRRSRRLRSGGCVGENIQGTLEGAVEKVRRVGCAPLAKAQPPVRQQSQREGALGALPMSRVLLADDDAKGVQTFVG